MAKYHKKCKNIPSILKKIMKNASIFTVKIFFTFCKNTFIQ